MGGARPEYAATGVESAGATGISDSCLPASLGAEIAFIEATTIGIWE